MTPAPDPQPTPAAGDDDAARIAAGYRSFATEEAPGRSALYGELAAGVAADAEVVDRIATLPRGKRQPNLVFAALRVHCGTPTGYPEFRRLLLEHWDAVTPTILRRRTQTNEPARCATLLPVLAALPQPLALLEVGASAGLCLLPDRYAYDYAGHRLGESSLVLPCDPQGPVPLPGRLPEVAWRAGLDLDPIDPRDPDEVAWLRALVWPGQEHRLDRLDRAIAIAAADPPPVRRGDLRTDLAALAAAAPADATLVVFHSAVLTYVPRADRPAFAAAVGRTGGVWVANEGPGVLDSDGAPALGDRPAGAFLLSVDGRPRAWTDPHGEWLRWPAGGAEPQR